jgi:tetratricopeptide (TPR) repeat protein
MSIRQMSSIAAAFCFCVFQQAVFSAETKPQATTVALTVALPSGADAAERELATSLLALLELEVAQDSKLSVVERRQIDLVLHELALSVDLSKSSEKKLRLGKLVNADLLLTTELLPRDNDSEVQNVLVRIVESLTGAIRGVVVTPVKAVSVDESAVDIAKYLSAIAARPSHAVVTVAVAPFESLGRFQRLRPMELGLRDMIATRLRRWGDLAAAGEDTDKAAVAAADSKSDSRSAPGSPFLVLQRSNMQQLLRELDLIQSGLADRSRLPKSLPTRAAAYLVHGTIDEQNENGFEIIVSAKLVHAASGKTVRDFEFVSVPKELPRKLAAQVDLIAGFLRHPDGSVSKTPGSLREINETELLFTQVVKDLRRYGRLTPVDFSSRRFELPKKVSIGAANGGTYHSLDKPQPRHALRKSIDRLESTLFIMPDRADVCFALGFCYAYHIDGIMNLERADELLRRAFSMDPKGPIGVSALRVLSEVCFHHQYGKCAPENRKLATSQLLFAFRSMPDEAKNTRWSRLPKLIRDVYPRDDVSGLAAVSEEIAKAAESAPEKYQYNLTMNAVKFASVDQLEKWASGNNLTLKQVACRSLGHRAWGEKNFQKSADWFLTAADALAADEKMRESPFVDNFRILAAGALLQGNKTNEALQLLESFRPKNDGSVNVGYWAQRIGDCYEKLGQPERALAIYVEVANQDEGYVNNTDIVRRIKRLGGVPLSEDREIDVRYIKGPPGGTSSTLALATDGNVIFSAGNYAGSATGKAGRGILAYDPATETWQDLSPAGLGRVTCVDYGNGELWVGTDANGLWRGDASGKEWKHFTTDDGLPDMSIRAVAVNASGVYVGVGSGGGGVVRIGPDDAVVILEGQGAPTGTPVDIVTHDGILFVSTGNRIQEMNLETGKWKSLGSDSVCRVFGTESGVWGSFYSHELFRMSELKVALKELEDRRKQSKGRKSANFVPSFRSLKFEDSHYKGSWFPRGTGRSGYLVKFAVEWDGDIWFGGSPWYRFQSAGLYRCNMKTGEFTMFRPHDGLRPSTTYMTYDAVVRGNELHVATSAGLAVVTRRDVKK